jgi:hypothetical protein
MDEPRLIIARMPVWARLVVSIGGAKAALGLMLYLSGIDFGAPPPLVPGWVYATLASAFMVLGSLLVMGNRQDPRAAWLGGILVLIASALAPLVNLFPNPNWSSAITYLRPEAFLPAFLWRFLGEFPSPLTATPAKVVRWAATMSLVVGAWCAAANYSAAWIAVSAGDIRAPFLVNAAYWALIFGISVPVLPALLWRARVAEPADQPRMQWFVNGLVLGALPFTLEVIAEELIPAYKVFAATPTVRPVIGAFIFGTLAIVPFVTAYSVLFDRVVEVRVVLRTALQHALARYTILGLVAVPFVALAMFLYDHREEPLVTLMSGPRPVLLSSAAIVGMLAMRLRHRWLDAVDRRYFREPYDAQQILTRFVGSLHAENQDELAKRVKREVERALHADAELFIANEARTALRHAGGSLGALAANATLVELALNDPRPMDVDVDQAGSPLGRLPEAEKRWLAQGAFRLIVALRSGTGGIAGVLALSAKRSDLAYSVVDRHLLSAVAAASGLALDNLRLRSTPASPSEPPAQECLECSRLNPAEARVCTCGGAVAEAAAPHVLRGIFKLEQRIGAGGMGVVYRAVDLNLGRDVAIKTLPKVGPDQAARLRKEARAMAAVTHPNLAVVHGIESWQGIPFLVQEYLAGGTLAHMLARSHPPLVDALRLGVTLAEVLEQLHTAGIMHCDVKPGNIGFTHTGVVKLLDFGLARLLRDTRAPSDMSTTDAANFVPNPVAASASGVLAGTPYYMSPEAVRGERPTPAFDVWALSVVVFEIIAGRRPFEGTDSHRIFERILSDARPDLRVVYPQCPPQVAAVFDRLLALDPAVRPRDAGSLRRELKALQAPGG